MDTWELREHVTEEIHQRRDEGADVAEWTAAKARLEAEAPDDPAAWRALRERLFAAPYAAANPAAEPSTLDAIRALRPDGPRRMTVSPDTMEDRILGAWRGRIAGCVLGKPVEGWNRARIDRYLSLAGMADLDGFFPRLDPWPDGFPTAWLDSENIAGCLRENIARAERDDDIDYTILGLHTVERFGPHFTTDNVAALWLDLLPFHQVFTAERVAYRNLVNGLRPPHAATHQNPYREWIGAQIRADGFGYINAGHPERAADMAFRDAAVSHVKNGIYGEMWAAAMIAAAFAATDPREAIEIGLSEIPAQSRLAEAGRKTLAWSREYATWEQCWERAEQDYGHLHSAHTLNNAVYVMIGLLYGERNFGRTIAIAVRCGMDTDCNGATAGSVLGAMLGASGVPSNWVEPFQDRVRSFVAGFDGSRVTDLAGRTFEQHRRWNDAA